MPSDAEKMPMVPMNSFTGRPRSTCTFLKTSSASGGRAAGACPRSVTPARKQVAATAKARRVQDEA
jgi:hypothetical protein